MVFLSISQCLINVLVTESAVISKWFKGRELAFALGIDISISRLASVINDIIQPNVYDAGGMQLCTNSIL